MLARVSPRLLPWPFALPTLRVSLFEWKNCHRRRRERERENEANETIDANLFKDAFLKAQKENEEIFKKADAESA